MHLDSETDVLDGYADGDDLPDIAWVQLKGEVIDQRCISMYRYGYCRNMIDRYTSVNLRCRELLAGLRSAATRSVTR